MRIKALDRGGEDGGVFFAFGYAVGTGIGFVVVRVLRVAEWVGAYGFPDVSTASSASGRQS